MNLWEKILSLEREIERGPKTQLVKIGLLVISLSIICGVSFSLNITFYDQQKTKTLAKNIQVLEKAGMDGRIEQLKYLHYDRSVSY